MPNFKLKVTKLGNLIKEKKLQTLLVLYALFAPVCTVGAADAKWNAVIAFILPWISRLGGVVILIGAVEFGLAFKNDDAEGKTKGIRTVIAGCIVLGVGLSSSTFLY
jgi:hypothetical protein